jgi:hypothetical protein
MAPRVQPKGVGEAPSIQTTGAGAYPIDPFNRAPESNLGRLAAALGDLVPSLRGIAGEARESDQKKGEEQAQADFLAMKQTGQRIKAGEIPASGSPWFRRHYHETIGRLSASQYDSDLAVAMQDPSTGLTESTDPADFDRFAGEFRSKWLEQNAGAANPDFIAGFNGSAVGYEVNARSNFAASAGARLEGKSLKALYAEQQVAIADILKAGGSPQQIADFIKIRNQQQYFLNPKSGTQISETTIQAVFDAARAYGDTNLLGILDHIDSGVPGATLAQTQSVMSKIQEVKNQIHSDIKKEDAAAEFTQKKQRTQAIANAHDGLWEALDASDNPADVDPKQWADLLTGIAPTEKERLYRIKEAYVRRDQQETVAQAGPLFERAFRGSLTFEEVADAFSVGQINKDTAKELRSQIRLNRAGKGAKALIQDPYYKSASNELEGLYKNNMGQFFTPVTAAQATVAKWTLQRDWVKFKMGLGREVGEEEANIWLQQRAAELFSRDVGVPISAEPQKQAQQILADFAARQDPAQLTDWSKSRIVSTNFLNRIRQEHAKNQQAGKNMFSPAVNSFLRGYRINTPEDVEKFLTSQTSLPER